VVIVVWVVVAAFKPGAATLFDWGALHANSVMLIKMYFMFFI
jgi:hypothetical protein